MSIDTHEVYIDSGTTLEAALASLWAMFAREFGTDHEDGFLPPFGKDAFIRSARLAVRNGIVGMAIPDDPPWVEIR